MQAFEKQYLQTMETILLEGSDEVDRTGVGTREIWGAHLRFDLADGFPALTTKQVRWHKALAELTWMMTGSTNVADLHKVGVKYWDDWAGPDGDLGPVYGHQWRKWETWGVGDISDSTDQLAEAISQVVERSSSRRIIVSAWNPADIGAMRLPPCHLLYQFKLSDDRLNCAVYQRSADWFLGVPFNMVMYAGLTSYVAALAGLEPGILSMTFASAHLYQNHLEQARNQMEREPINSIARLSVDVLPRLKHASGTELRAEVAEHLDHAHPSMFMVTGYESHSHIEAPIAV